MMVFMDGIHGNSMDTARQAVNAITTSNRGGLAPVAGLSGGGGNDGRLLGGGEW